MGIVSNVEIVASPELIVVGGFIVVIFRIFFVTNGGCCFGAGAVGADFGGCRSIGC